MITAFLPCRKGSQRVIDKNIRPFAGYEKGLIQIKLQQLLNTTEIDSIVLSTNDETIIAYADALNEKKIKIHRRDDSLGSSETSTDALVSHVLDLITEGHVLWTHVTSPFFGTDHYKKAIGLYLKALNEGYDSLMSVSVIHGFLWNKRQPINYDRSKEKWPRTQTIEPLYEINSALFINSVENYRNYNDRIGNKPYLFETDKVAGFDIDWPDDFAIGESIARAGIVNNEKNN
ncbi:MAG: acylneuraminate cytidylyltransferase family protein [Methylovulum miyakonense]|uniref:acylneuraminate cytidylyltransferase family protein n=1 Tax=Methylovulum miyakonense TaxID=645578 RepID=UPI003BB55667